MVWVPTVRAAVVKVTAPLASSVPVPSVVPPSRKVTVPAVRVTDWP